MHDNALAKALSDVGLDVSLVPTYTPIRTDDTDFSVDQIFFGGVNVYLQQKFPPLRWLPNFLDRFLDNPSFVRRVTSRSIDMSQSELGKLAVSMLSGLHGNQRKEVKRLCSWLERHARPDVLVFTNALIGGCIPEIKRRLGVPVLVTLQGDDVFLDSLSDGFRAKCIGLIKKLVPAIDGFIVHTEFFKKYMSEYFEIPPEKIHVTPLGIDQADCEQIQKKRSASDSLAIGYLARLAPEKGLHNIVDAFLRLKSSGEFRKLKFKVAGWLGASNRAYADENFNKIVAAGFGDDFEYLGVIDRSEKLEFLSSIDVFSVPTEYLEPKGLYVLEAMACGVPVVLPSLGAFPELIEPTGGGLLFEAGNSADYDAKLRVLLLDSEMRQELGESAKTIVQQTRNSIAMGEFTKTVIEKVLDDSRNSS